ncbi:MAG: hypothetical protein JKY42_05200 [Flavobacteriales bacterium]|nr:hypothetical protein [Flavobacteriales bacterium]
MLTAAEFMSFTIKSRIEFIKTYARPIKKATIGNDLFVELYQLFEFHVIVHFNIQNRNVISIAPISRSAIRFI